MPSRRKGPLDPIHVRFGQLVRQCRTMAGLSQVDLAINAGISVSGIVSYNELGGGINLSNALHLAKYLGISLDQLAAEMIGDEPRLEVRLQAKH